MGAKTVSYYLMSAICQCSMLYCTTMSARLMLPLVNITTTTLNMSGGDSHGNARMQQVLVFSCTYEPWKIHPLLTQKCSTVNRSKLGEKHHKLERESLFLKGIRPVDLSCTCIDLMRDKSLENLLSRMHSPLWDRTWWSSVSSCSASRSSGPFVQHTWNPTNRKSVLVPTYTRTLSSAWCVQCTQSACSAWCTVNREFKNKFNYGPKSAQDAEKNSQNLSVHGKYVLNIFQQVEWMEGIR